MPLNVPPAGEPVKVAADVLIQYEADRPVKLTTGNAFTVTVCEILFVQPFPLV